MPDASALAVLSEDLQTDGVLAVRHEHGKARLDVTPASVPETLAALKAKGFRSLVSVHGLDYYPHEPRLGVQYELLYDANGEFITAMGLFAYPVTLFVSADGIVIKQSGQLDEQQLTELIESELL